MCRSIKTLRDLEPPATEEDVRAAAVQFVRKISGYRTPSKINEIAFLTAVEEIARASAQLFASLQSTAVPRRCAAPASEAEVATGPG